DLDARGGLLSRRPELVQTEAHLVGDVAGVAAAAGGAAVVHLETPHQSFGVELDRLRVLPADVEHRARAGKHRVRAEAVAENLAADLLLRERQALASVAGADRGDDLERRRK